MPTVSKCWSHEWRQERCMVSSCFTGKRERHSRTTIVAFPSFASGSRLCRSAGPFAKGAAGESLCLGERTLSKVDAWQWREASICSVDPSLVTEYEIGCTACHGGLRSEQSTLQSCLCERMMCWFMLDFMLLQCGQGKLFKTQRHVVCRDMLRTRSAGSGAQDLDFL